MTHVEHVTAEALEEIDAIADRLIRINGKVYAAVDAEEIPEDSVMNEYDQDCLYSDVADAVAILGRAVKAMKSGKLHAGWTQ